MWEDYVGHLWRADADGGNPRELAAIPGGEQIVDVSPDGRTVLFLPRANYEELWTVDVVGGPPVKVAGPIPLQRNDTARFSHDGARILYSSPREAEGHTRTVWNVIPASGGEPMMTLTLPPQASDVEWAPDGKSLTFLDQVDGEWNVFRQRLEGGKTEQVTRFAEGEISAHEWSPDGSRLLLARRTKHENVWVAASDGSHPVQLTHFETGRLFQVNWVPPDGRRILFRYGQESSDVVLIRNFR